MKIPAEFLPRSWEMPQGARVLEESASVVAREFDGERLDWLVALVEIPVWVQSNVALWMRPLNTRFDAGFIVFGDRVWNSIPFDRNTGTSALEALASSKLEGNFLARHFFLNKQGELRREDEAAYETVLIAPDGFAAWSLGTFTNEVRYSSAFRWSSPLTNVEFLRLPALKLWLRLKEMLTDAEGDAFFARCFALMSQKERQELVIGMPFGTDEEVKKLLRDILLFQNIWNEVPNVQEIDFVSHAIAPNQLWYDDYYGEWGLNVPASLNIATAQLLNVFRPLNQEIHDRFCAQEWAKINTDGFHISVPRPTAHEQLEAQLRWREWLASVEER